MSGSNDDTTKELTEKLKKLMKSPVSKYFKYFE